jgi:PHD/YefM family antitoxin component YafN of YafNO toxin-antitoxin module
LCQLQDVAIVQNPVKICVVFSANEFVIISNRDQETQTKPETSEEILESSDASSVAVLKFISTPCTLFSM